MTLVVGAQNNSYALQVSDRRLTAEDGSVVDEESNKLVIFDSDACRFVVGFTGLAKLSGVNGFQTNAWLCEALREAAPPDYIPTGIVERLRLAATQRFGTHSVRRLRSGARRMTILLTGFLYTTKGTIPAYCTISNFQDFVTGKDYEDPWPEFSARLGFPEDVVSAWAVQRIGYWQPFGPPEIESIRTLLCDSRPAAAVVGKAVELIRAISGAPGSLSPVGRQLMSASFRRPAHPSSPITPT